MALAGLPVALGGSNNFVSQNNINQAFWHSSVHLVNSWIVWKKIMSRVCPRKQRTKDVSKVKISGSKIKRAKAPVKQQRSDVNAIPASVPMYTIPDRLHEEARIQVEVQNHMLAYNAKPSTEKIKSQRRGGVCADVFVSNRVKWPHEFILSGQNKDRISYNQLSPIQWMGGACPHVGVGKFIPRSPSEV